MTTPEFVALIQTRERIQGYQLAALLELPEHEEVELSQASEVEARWNVDPSATATVPVSGSGDRGCSCLK